MFEVRPIRCQIAKRCAMFSISSRTFQNIQRPIRLFHVTQHSQTNLHCTFSIYNFFYKINSNNQFFGYEPKVLSVHKYHPRPEEAAPRNPAGTSKRPGDLQVDLVHNRSPEEPTCQVTSQDGDNTQQHAEDAYNAQEEQLETLPSKVHGPMWGPRHNPGDPG